MEIFLLFLLFCESIIVVLLLLYHFKYLKEFDRLNTNIFSLRNKHDSEREDWQIQIDKLSTENRRLSKWEVVANADEEAARILNQAHASMDASLADAKQIIADAKEKARNFNEEATARLNTSTLKSIEIVEAAKIKAHDIAGSAFDAMSKATLYEKTAKAMKNIIEGYGYEYLKPSHSLLDDLADDFSHKEAGQLLRVARDRSSVMISNGTAAKCEYVEANRRDTAIEFVIDAFNGKVDSILSRVKSDNAGKLSQEIRDAFTQINFQARAFRDARITEEYLEARLDELRWAAVAQQLKVEEQAEQRRIKDQIREEEKARKELERAIKDAEKEEDIIKKAMEKAQKQIDAANAEQKAKYEKQLEELQLKLKDAEERNQRAKSMAEQTKRGHVYIISNIGSFGEDVFKIGLTRRLEPIDRVRELGDSSVPFEFDVHAMIYSEDAPALENALHKHFVLSQLNKVNHRKEFFKVNLTHIKEEIDSLGVNAHWTMIAEAREFKESLAIEKAINENPANKEAWINRQLELDSVPLIINENIEDN